MRALRIAAAGALLLLFSLIGCSNVAFCADVTPDEYYEYGVERIVESVPDSMKDCLDGELREDDGVLDAFKRLAEDIADSFGDIAKTPLSLLASVCACLIVCSAAKAIGASARPGVGSAIDFCCALAAALAVSGPALKLLNKTETALSVMSTAAASAVPVYAGLMTATGNAANAALFGLAASAVSSCAALVVENVVRPLTGVLLGLAVVSGTGENGMSSLANAVKKTSVWVLGAATSVFLSAISLQSLVTKNADALALKAARFLMVSGVPIIGSSVSEAAVTVVSSLKVVKGALGTAGIVALAAASAPCLIELSLCGAALSLCCVFAEITGLDGPKHSLSVIKAAFDITTATLAFYLVSLVVCTAVVIGAS